MTAKLRQYDSKGKQIGADILDVTEDVRTDADGSVRRSTRDKAKVLRSVLLTAPFVTPLPVVAGALKIVIDKTGADVGAAVDSGTKLRAVYTAPAGRPDLADAPVNIRWDNLADRRPDGATYTPTDNDDGEPLVATAEFADTKRNCADTVNVNAITAPPAPPPTTPPVVTPPPTGDYQTVLRDRLISQMARKNEIQIGMNPGFDQAKGAVKRGGLGGYEVAWLTAFGEVGAARPVPVRMTDLVLQAYEGGKWREVQSSPSPGVTGEWGDEFLSWDTVTGASFPSGAWVGAASDDTTELQLKGSAVMFHGTALAREKINNPTCMIASMVVWAPALAAGQKSGVGVSIGLDATSSANSGGVGSGTYSGDDGIGPVIEAMLLKRACLVYWGTLPATLPTLDGVDLAILSRS